MRCRGTYIRMRRVGVAVKGGREEWKVIERREDEKTREGQRGRSEEDEAQ